MHIAKSHLDCGLCGRPMTRIGNVTGCLDCGITDEGISSGQKNVTTTSSSSETPSPRTKTRGDDAMNEEPDDLETAREENVCLFCGDDADYRFQDDSLGSVPVCARHLEVVDEKLEEDAVDGPS